MISHQALHFDCNLPELNKAFRIAFGTVMSNLMPYSNGLLEEHRSCIMAGLDYDKPWTRDAAINAWNGTSLFLPAVSQDTLLSVLTSEEDGVRIGGQYWDAIIWVTGAWNHYLYTGDLEFLTIAHQAAVNSLVYFEKTEFDQERNLFRGPACYGDGISAYPNHYAQQCPSCAVWEWPKYNTDQVAKPGYGLPMFALSTNCLYYNAYRLINHMATQLDLPLDKQWDSKADKLKAAINKNYWNAEKGHYSYILDAEGCCSSQEALGHSFALMFGIPDEAQVNTIFENQYVSPAGIPCLWPNFDRYQLDDNAFGRHSGTVWPHAQGFWAQAAACYGKTEIFSHELFQLAKYACRDSQFTEIYHPITGDIYGGVQESDGQGIIEWVSCQGQTWSATAFLRMLLFGLLGMKCTPEGVAFNPCVPDRIDCIELSNLQYHGMLLNIAVKGHGTTVEQCLINHKPAEAAFVRHSFNGDMMVELSLTD